MKTRTDELISYITGAETRLTEIDNATQKLREKRAGLVEQRRLAFDSTGNSPSDNILRRFARTLTSVETPEAPDTLDIDNQIKDIDMELGANNQLFRSISGEIISYQDELKSFDTAVIDDSLVARYLAPRYTI